MDDLLYRLGKSKAERMQENYLYVEKDQAMQIIKKCGGDCFALWFYIEGKCYGREKVFAFPAVETIASEFGKDKKTIKRWMSALEQSGALKRVAAFTPKGQQLSNVYIVNAEFPEIPEGWNEMFPDGVVLANNKISDRGEYLATDFGSKSGGTKMSPTQNLSPAQNCPPKKEKSFDSFKKYKKDVCMGDSDESGEVSEVYTSLKETAKTVIICNGVKDVHGETMLNYVLVQDAEEIFVTLKKKYPNQLSAEVAALACSIFEKKFLQAAKAKKDFCIDNAVGWFMFCYSEAIKEYKIKVKKEAI